MDQIVINVDSRKMKTIPLAKKGGAMIDIDIKDALNCIGDTTVSVANLATPMCSPWKFESEFLEANTDADGKPSGCQYVINANARNGLFSWDEVEKALNVLHEIAYRISEQFNLICGKKDGDDGAWYVHGEPFYWRADDEESDRDEDEECDVATVQYCIFNY